MAQMTDPLTELRRARLAREMTHQAPPAAPTMHPLDAAAMGTTLIPGVGDVLGAAADIRRFIQEPETRTPANFGLAALGMLPFVPPALAGAGAALARANRGTELSTLARTRPGERGMFGGPRAKTADLAALNRAIEMADKGADATDIWQQTGWWIRAPGGPTPPGGIPRFEIDDSRVEFKGHYPESPADSMLDITDNAMIAGNIDPWNFSPADLVEHPELFKAYPELTRALARTPDLEGATRGRWRDPKPDEQARLDISYKLDPTTGMGVTLHELQHGIQGVEGFPGGGMPTDMADETSDILKGEWGAINRRIAQLQALGEDTERMKKFKLTPEILNRQLESAVARKDQVLTEFNNHRYELYRKLGGEAEARAVQKRMNLSPTERRMIPPWESYDTPINELINIPKKRAWE